MNLQFLGDALDHWKGSVFESLQKSLLLCDFRVDAMASDSAGWRQHEYKLYAKLLRIEQHQVVPHKNILSVDRNKYFNEITVMCDLFLDPDTGLAPNRAGTEHVKPDEVLLIWESLKEGDFLVLYQHSFRSKNWVNIRKKQLAEACQVEENKVGEWSSDLAKDVIYFFVTR